MGRQRRCPFPPVPHFLLPLGVPEQQAQQVQHNTPPHSPGSSPSPNPHPEQNVNIVGQPGTLGGPAGPLVDLPQQQGSRVPLSPGNGAARAAQVGHGATLPWARPAPEHRHLLGSRRHLLGSWARANQPQGPHLPSAAPGRPWASTRRDQVAPGGGPGLSLQRCITVLT